MAGGGKERVPGEDGGGRAVDEVGGLAAAAGFRTVQHVVVQERGHMYHFRNDGQFVKLGPVRPEKAGGKQGEQGAQALASGHEHMTHDIAQRSGHGGQFLFQSLVDFELFVFEHGYESDHDILS